MLSEWKNIKLDMEPNIRVVPKVEIDESKIISNLEKVYNFLHMCNFLFTFLTEI